MLKILVQGNQKEREKKAGTVQKTKLINYRKLFKVFNILVMRRFFRIRKVDLRKIMNQEKTEVKVKTKLQPDDWLCLKCNKKITEDKERFLYYNKSEFEFKNPDGFIFNIMTFKTADGCRDEGKPTLDFTWFEKYSWCFAICSRCGLHLGWKYSGTFSFYGLIKARLIKGAALFN